MVQQDYTAVLCSKRQKPITQSPTGQQSPLQKKINGIETTSTSKDKSNQTTVLPSSTNNNLTTSNSNTLKSKDDVQMQAFLTTEEKQNYL